MKMKWRKPTEKQWLYLAIFVTFITILIYELLTPMFSDDFGYQARVNQAGSIADLFRQEKAHYLGWTGRSVVHMIMRLFMYTKSMTVFHVCAAGVFTLLTVWMYRLAGGEDSSHTLGMTEKGLGMTAGPSTGSGTAMKGSRKAGLTEGTVLRYVLGVLLLWVFGVKFAETVLWMTGACNYLFGTTIILGDMWLYDCLYREKGSSHALGMTEKGLGMAKRGIDVTAGPSTGSGTAKEGSGIVKTIGAVVLGVLSGWCNENTSGGLILYVVILMLWMKRAEKRKIPTAMKAGLIANLAGFVLMIFAPGNLGRAAAQDAGGGFLTRLPARFLAVTNSMYTLFFPLLVAAVILGVLMHYRGLKFEQTKRFYLFLLLFVATSYALVLAPSAEDRAFFGAGVFLFIALVHGVGVVTEGTVLLSSPAGPSTGSGTAEDSSHTLGMTERGLGMTGEALARVLVYSLALYLFFSYIDNGAKLAFINREITERMNYLQAQADAGAEESGAAILRPQFESKYSVAYDMDIQEDWKYWINWMYADYYGFHLVWGVERDEWTEY